MSYIDSTYVDALIGSDLRQGFFRDAAGVYQSTEFDGVLEVAKAEIVMALRDAGYVEPTDAELTAMLAGTEQQANDARIIQAATFGASLVRSDIRHERRIEAANRESLSLKRKIREGQIKLKTLTVEQQNAIGGVTAPTVITTSSSSATNKKPVFGRGMGR